MKSTRIPMTGSTGVLLVLFMAACGADPPTPPQPDHLKEALIASSHPTAPKVEACSSITMDPDLGTLITVLDSKTRPHGDGLCDWTVAVKKPISRMRVRIICYDAGGVKVDDTGDSLMDMEAGDKAKLSVSCPAETARVTMKMDG